MRLFHLPPQPPVVDLSHQALQAAVRQVLLHAGSGLGPAAPPSAAEAASPAAPAVPFAAERGLVDAALVCLSTGSSGERQHAFAQQLIRQLAALGDALQQQQQQQQQQRSHAGGPAATHACAPTLQAAAAAAASPAAVQASVWTRLALLLPLLPLVYKHRAADAASSLRGQLLRALLRLLAAPAVRADAVHARAAAAGAPDAAAAEAAAAAAEAAGEPLPQRLLHLLRALLVGGWASWMRLEGALAAAECAVVCCSPGFCGHACSRRCRWPSCPIPPGTRCAWPRT